MLVPRHTKLAGSTDLESSWVLMRACQSACGLSDNSGPAPCLISNSGWPVGMLRSLEEILLEAMR